MTWVIGSPGMFGYAVGLSDIRVTFRNGTEKDCLQKVHRVGRNIALGFAGSVKIGLAMVARISAALDGQDPKAMWNPLQVGERFPELMQATFNDFSLEERSGHCHLIFLSAHPIEKDGEAPWARCYVHRFYSPDFRPQIARPREILSIGSGADISKYTEKLRKLETDTGVMHLESMMPGGLALGYIEYITSAIEKNPRPGISPHLHVCMVRRDGVMLGTNDSRVQDHPEEDFVMPRVARTWDELINLREGTATSLDLATC